DPDIEKNGPAASPATALASSVLPVPGGPMSRAPSRRRAPRRWNFKGSFRNSMISSSSCLASSQPATSAKVILGVSPVSSLARDFPNANARLPPCCICRSMKIIRPPMRITGHRFRMMTPMPGLGSLPVMSTPFDRTPFTHVGSVSKGHHGEVRRGLPLHGDRPLEVAADLLAADDLQRLDVPRVELL